MPVFLSIEASTKLFFCSRSFIFSKLVDEIIENEYVVNDNEIFTILNLESFGIKNEHGKYSFIDTIDNIIEKKDKLGINLETEEEFEICYKLKIHYKRWKKLCS